MKKNEIKVGGLYSAKVNGQITTVRVNRIGETYDHRVVYHVTNLATGRELKPFRSAVKFRSVANPTPAAPAAATLPTAAAVEEKAVEPTAAPFSETSTATPSHSATLEKMTGSPNGNMSDNATVSKEEATEMAYPEKTADKLRLEESGLDKPFDFQKIGTPEWKASVKHYQETGKPAPVPPAALEAQNKINLAAKLKEQAAKEASDTAPHLIIDAKAGTGKTTTLVEGLKVVRGSGSKLIPSPQQKAVWDSMALSGNARSVCFVAFNRSIADELRTRVPSGCDAMTMHSMGLKAVTKAFGRLDINQYTVQDIIADILHMDIREARQKKLVVLKATEDLVSLCKMNVALASPTMEPWTEEALDKLASHYEVDTNGHREEIYHLVPEVLERCKAPKGRINYDDMIWLPVILQLPIVRYDLLLVDEAQDLNRCQQALAKRAGKRLILCGDPRQAIYGFAGADAESMHRMEDELSQEPNGCVVLPLSVTRRCGRAIVAEANKIVPDFSAHESNCEGKVTTARLKVTDDKVSPPSSNLNYRSQVEDGDFILCRVNAPLVSQCFRFLKQGRKANIIGRDIGTGIINLIKKLKAESVERLIERLTDWSAKEQAKEQAKRFPSEGKIIAIQDKCDCLLCFCEGMETVDDVIRKVESVFTDDKQTAGIRLSSVHKAKGLEAKRVFILLPEGGGMPHPMAKSQWQIEQEYNLKYVAITRAIEHLVWVS
jgi:DNA helicase II / ATP-dependent DNA helicase PcrA